MALRICSKPALSAVAQFARGSVLRAAVAGLLSGGLVIPAYSQNFSHTTDRIVPRYCTNTCVQSFEKLVVDASGNGTAVWREPYQYDSNYQVIVTARYSASSHTWSSARALSVGSNVSAPHIGADTRGNVMIAWTEYDTENGGYATRTWRHVPSYGWMDVGLYLREYDYDAVPLSLSVGLNGHVAVVLRATYRYDWPSRPLERVAIFDPNTGGWMTHYNPPKIDKIAVLPNGNAVSVGIVDSGDGFTQMIAHRYDRAMNAWVEPRTLEPTTSLATSFQSLTLSADRIGNAAVFYDRFNSNTGARQFKTFRFSGSSRTWTAKTLPRTSSTRISASEMTGDRYGNFYLAWNQYSGSYAKTLVSRYSGSGGTWSSPRILSGNFHTRDPNVASDYAGNVQVTWSQRADAGTGNSSSATFRTYSARFGNSVWSAPVLIQDATTRNAYKSFVGMDNAARAVVMWTQNTGQFINGVPVKHIRSDRLVPR